MTHLHAISVCVGCQPKPLKCLYPVGVILTRRKLSLPFAMLEAGPCVLSWQYVRCRCSEFSTSSPCFYPNLVVENMRFPLYWLSVDTASVVLTAFSPSLIQEWQLLWNLRWKRLLPWRWYSLAFRCFCWVYVAHKAGVWQDILRTTAPHPIKSIRYAALELDSGTQIMWICEMPYRIWVGVVVRMGHTCKPWLLVLRVWNVP